MLKFSIITVVYNNEKYIKDAIESVLSQDYPNIEYIVIDGASKDKTIDIINQYKDKISQFVSEPDKGIYDAMNKGIKLATGDVIGILNSDDFYVNNQVISNYANVFNTTNCNIVYSDVEYVEQNNTNKTIRFWKAGTFTKNKLNRGWMPPHPSFFCKKTLFEELGTYNINYKIAADYELMVRFLKHSTAVTYLPITSIKMRWGGTSNQNIIKKMKEDYNVIKSNKIGGIYTLVLKNLRKIKQFF